MDERANLDTQSLLDELSDEKLCEMVSNGHQEAEDELVSRYWHMVKQLARPYFLAGGDSEDLIQEGMLGLVNAIRRYDGLRSNFKTFVTICVRHRIYSAIRNAHGKKNDMLNMALSFEQLCSDDKEISKDIITIAKEYDPESFVIGREDAVQLKTTISKLLSDFEKRVLSLYLDGQSYSEMSLHLNRPVKSVDNAVQRIRKKLAHLY